MMKNNRLLPIIGRAAARSPWITAGLAVSVAASVATSLIPPLVLESIVDKLTGSGITVSLALIFFASLAVSGISDSLREMFLTAFGQKITHVVRHAMCAKLSRLPASYFTKNEPGATVSRFVGDVDTVETLFASGVVGMFADACKIFSILAVIFVKNRGLGIMMVALVPVLFLFTRIVQKRMLAAQLKNRASVAKLNSFVPETLANLRMIRIFRREKYMEDKYDRRIGESYAAVERANFYDAIYSPVILIISAVIIAVMMVMAATDGRMQTFFGMTVGGAVAVIAFVGKVFDPLESIGMEIQSLQSAVAGVRRIKELLVETERSDTDASLTAENLILAYAEAVVFDNVTFGYGEDGRVIDRLSFTVKVGESVTLAGRTGAGKSTVLKLLLGLYSPEGGCVKVFGVPADSIPDNIKRRLFGYVEQSFRPVPGSVGEQISAFDDNISSTGVEYAAALVGIDDAIRALPHGYDTPYTDSLFSQGQKQLLSIARAVASNPAVLLLDEITANLDSDTEKKVLDALGNASEKRTVISISHRLYEHTGGRIIKI